MAFYQNGSVLGANLGNSDGATAKFTLGMRVPGSNDTEWVYVRANVALTTGHVVLVNSAFSAALATGNVQGKELAFAQGTFTASDYGFVAKRGLGIYVKVTAAVTAGKQLYINTNGSGTLKRASATATLMGITLISNSLTAVRKTVLAYATWPRVVAAPG